MNDYDCLSNQQSSILNVVEGWLIKTFLCIKCINSLVVMMVITKKNKMCRVRFLYENLV